MTTIKPFENEEDSINIGDLTVENRLDRIELYGSVQITRDKEGLRLALELKQLVDETVKALRAEEDAKALPDHISDAPTDRVDNPFGS